MTKNFLEIKIGINTFHKTLFLLFLFFALLTPADYFGFKLVSFVAIMFFNIDIILDFISKKKNFYFFFFTIIFPFCLFIFSVIRTYNFIETIKYLYIFTYIFLIPICEERKIDYTKMFMIIVNFLSVIIVASSVLDKIGIIPIAANPLLMFLNDTGEAQISVSPYAMFHYVLFLNASPLILISFSYFLFNKKIFLSVLNFLALIFSGTRANIYLGLIALLIFIFFEGSIKLLKPFLIALVVLIVFLFSGTFIEKVATINWAKNTGDQIRSLNAQSILDTLNKNPSNYLWGTGIRTYYFSLGRNDFINDSELTYLELLRQTGLIGLIPLLIFLLRPLIAFIKNGKYFWLVTGYSLYLMKCIIDPFLFTSTGFLLITLVYFEFRKTINLRTEGDN
ncbi:O-antigen ligase family protein [Enterococcus dongliensis]|uniref:O-antigen ligase family protein n=1 Tax=Enterococcus dongliensis TaxID=2559925 RepID=UPI00288D889A|nr:O-antigen ligase family protein [Enterococcus dongliensis]MDT2634764.1 O-antigen ligase family protein [Enterococcus dongliensis]MDT2669255.1 O-antigen ligase family protein [Enterococcus dongliensis]